ncbi:MAG: methyltransferase [Syntrophorhabdus aromaticivorans]|uniref:Methyltransferase n=2 Tax=Syntrophorhabdus aromaticivorans TaxID=328301 RepID=A0A971M6M1_9BACT|nr:methyltransferase [Syntrophorhabdus aromaticivorans]
MKVKETVYADQSDYQRIAIYDTEVYGRCLFLDDVIQCSETDHKVYDTAILGKLGSANKNLLVLGGGDGHTAQMALSLNPGLRVTVVELDKAVVKACETYLDQDIYHHPNITIVIDDAIHFMEQTSVGSYDCVVCDLTDMPIGHNGVVCKEFYQKVFSHVHRVLNRSGWIAVYAGCDVEIADDIARAYAHHIEKRTVYVPSFGEPCFIVYGRNIQHIS